MANIPGISQNPQKSDRYVLFDRESRLYVVRAPFSTEDWTRLHIANQQNERRVPAQMASWAIEQVLPVLQARYPQADFVAELAALPCPKCGCEMEMSDRDFIYPCNRERTQLNAGHWIHNFGCGYVVYGATLEEVVRKWNDGVPHEGDADDLIENQRPHEEDQGHELL